MLLAWATSSKTKKLVKMSYANYDQRIVETHGCKIIGVDKLVNPSDIGTLDALQKVRDTWASGSAQWVRLTTSQIEAHMAEVEEARVRNKTPAKVRKQRSDAGQSRGGKRKASNKEKAQPTKKVKHTRNQLPPKSREVIDSSDEEDEDKSGNVEDALGE